MLACLPRVQLQAHTSLIWISAASHKDDLVPEALAIWNPSLHLLGWGTSSLQAKFDQRDYFHVARGILALKVFKIV